MLLFDPFHFLGSFLLGFDTLYQNFMHLKFYFLNLINNYCLHLAGLCDELKHLQIYFTFLLYVLFQNHIHLEMTTTLLV